MIQVPDMAIQEALVMKIDFPKTRNSTGSVTSVSYLVTVSGSRARPFQK